MAKECHRFPLRSVDAAPKYLHLFCLRRQGRSSSSRVQLQHECSRLRPRSVWLWRSNTGMHLIGRPFRVLRRWASGISGGGELLVAEADAPEVAKVNAPLSNTPPEWRDLRPYSWPYLEMWWLLFTREAGCCLSRFGAAGVCNAPSYTRGVFVPTVATHHTGMQRLPSTPSKCALPESASAGLRAG